ncbi:MAG: HIT domain-containing protein [Chitinivibrionales bacterium]|nr:HIT domain-containing protein [Chitinivibrionales bacterium]
MLNHADLKVPGHLILKPRVHYESVAEIPDSLAVTIGPLFKRVTAALKAVCRPEKIYIAAFGDSFPDLHWHFFPRYAHMPVPASATLAEFDSGKYSCSEEEAARVAEGIREQFQGASGSTDRGMADGSKPHGPGGQDGCGTAVDSAN